MYHQLPIEVIGDLALDVASNHQEATGELGLFPGIDELMDRHQSEAYRLLKKLRDAHPDKLTRTLIQRALVHLAHAERYEQINEVHVSVGTRNVVRASEHNIRLIAVTEAERVRAVMARRKKRPGQAGLPGLVGPS